MKKILLFLTVCFTYKFSISQTQYNVLHWNVDNGLAYDQTYCMLKDIYGFLWIGTTEGLSRFDGSSFENYYYDPGKKGAIGGSKITGLVEDSLHNIWIGTDKGLSRYDIKADTFTNFFPTIINAALSTFIVPFFVTLDEVYCQETDSLITSYNIHSYAKKILIKLNPADSVQRSLYAKQYFIFDANSNCIWILKDRGRGLLQISLSTHKRISYDCPGGEVMRYDSKRNSIWLNTDAGLIEFNLHDKQAQHIRALKELEKNSHDHIGLDFDHAGAVWFKTYPKGIFIYDRSNQSVVQPFAQDSLLNEIVSGENSVIYCDRDGIIWSGFWLRKGIYQFNPVSRPFTRYLADSSNNPWHNIIFNCVNGGHGKIWMGTAEDGIIIFDVQHKSYQILQLQNIWSIEKHPAVIPVYIDTIKQKAVLKIEGYKGLYVMDILSKEYIPLIFKNDNNQKINITEVYHSKKFYHTCIVNAEYAGHRSFFIVNIDSATATEVLSFSKNTINEDYATDGDQYLFLKGSTSKGNSTYSFLKSKWNRVTNPLDSTQWNNIIYNYVDKSYWVTASSGLLHYDLSFHLLRKYTSEDGLPYNEIFILLPDNKGNIWFNTNRYIYMLNTKAGVITRLSEKDGFVPQDFRSGDAGIKYTNGDLYFPGHGSAQGFVVLNPDKYKPTSAFVYFKSVNIKDFSLPYSISVNNVEEINLKYFQNRITVETGTIDYYSNGKGRIRYKLAGEERNENWQYAPANYTIRYEELPPGKYKLLIQAGNAGNEFIGPIKTLIFKINPSFWNTWWFRLAAALCVLSALYGIIRYRTRTKFRLRLERSEKETQLAEMRQRTAELKQQASELEMQALRAQMSPHFIFNSLNSINRFILQNNRAQASEYLTKFSKLVRMILQNSQASLITLESELEALQLYLEMEALRFNYHFDYKVSVPKELDIEVLKVPPLIIQPYVENAIWHGLMHKEEKGQLDIEVSQENNHLFFKITDNGVGRKKAAEVASKSATKHKSMGLRITANRIAIMQSANGNESPVTINDLVNVDGSAAGTEVIIKMSVIYD